jgi:conjugal transfer/entry exclusion protein
MKLILKEKQLKYLLENNLYYGDEKLPELTNQVINDIKESKQICSKLLSMLKTITVGDIIDNPEQYTNLLSKIESIYKKYYDKSKQYYRILETYESDFDNKNLMRFENSVYDLDTIVNDIDDIKELFEETIEKFNSDKIQYLNKEYPTQTIDITGNT